MREPLGVPVGNGSPLRGCAQLKPTRLNSESKSLRCDPELKASPEAELFHSATRVLMAYLTAIVKAQVGTMSLTADVGVMYYQWMQLRKAVDASALAGATYLLPQNATRTLPTPAINIGPA